MREAEWLGVSQAGLECGRDRMGNSLTASVRLGDGSNMAVLISDLASDGCKISTRRMLPVGETIRLDVPGRQSFQASVRWTTAARAGLKFI